MQQSSLMRFCDECGLANDPAATYCAACQSPLGSSGSVVSVPPIRPVPIASPVMREVTPGPLFSGGSQSISIRNASATGDFQPGTVLDGRYQIEREIGRGGFSVVYLAQGLRGSAGRRVAIKRIQLSKLSSRQIIDATETFNREITMLARFRGSEGVPKFYEHLTDPENLYLVMEYVAGTTLEEYLQKKHRGYLKESEVIDIGVEIAQIVQQLHRNNPLVIFRDLKPANIMITPKREFYLIDFGIARNFTPGKAKDTTPLGSPGFAPPEQYGRAQTDPRADIYSLGATLQTLVTGRDPLELRAGEVPRNPKAISPALRKLLDEMLAPNVVKRPPDMAAVQERLEKCQSIPAFWYSYRIGLAIGSFISIICLLLFFLSDFRVIIWIVNPIMWIFFSLGQTVRKRFVSRVRKLTGWITILGTLTILLPCLLFLLWYYFGWPL